ncbi:P-loop containing nucleoside triphosphate hydrolase protein [Chlamydoabsidia padenii]|nr:P-loop containing nucleoside triphosphate hydrolase protein [Chlamydoabsidia padenii]
MASTTNYSMLPQTKQSLDHILGHYQHFTQDRQTRQLKHKPLVVGVSGCQGSGKTTLCDTLVHLLRGEPYELNVVSFSLDDLYLTREEQAQLSASYPDNHLLQYRGQPGSHDLALAQVTFDALLGSDPTSTVSIPVYDKSLHGGLGDRLPRQDWQHIHGQIDIILFEGWSLGFKSVSLNQLQRMYQQSTLLQHHTLHHLAIINDFLIRYEQELYPKMDIFIHLAPTRLEQVYQWRLEQEHHMQQTRNVQGLADHAVRGFVDTYMPAYTLYLSRLNKVGFFGWEQELKRRDYEGWTRMDGGYTDNTMARHLRMVLDQRRQVVASHAIQPTQIASSSGSNSNRFYTLRTSLFKRSTFVLTVCTLGYVGWISYQRRQSIMKMVHQWME